MGDSFQLRGWQKWHSDTIQNNFVIWWCTEICYLTLQSHETFSKWVKLKKKKKTSKNQNACTPSPHTVLLSKALSNYKIKQSDWFITILFFKMVSYKTPGTKKKRIFKMKTKTNQQQKTWLPYLFQTFISIKCSSPGFSKMDKAGLQNCHHLQCVEPYSFIYIHENMENQNHCMSIKQARLTNIIY